MKQAGAPATSVGIEAGAFAFSQNRPLCMSLYKYIYKDLLSIRKRC